MSEIHQVVKSNITDEVGGFSKAQEPIQSASGERHSFSEMTISLEAERGWSEQGPGPFTQQEPWDACGTHLLRIEVLIMGSILRPKTQKLVENK